MSEPETDPTSWPAPPAALTLPGDEVHVWRASLHAPAPWVRHFADTLSPDERARAARFAVPGDGERFTVARGVLRHLLARYAGADPAGLRFTYGPHGKPELSGQSWLGFNLSHARGLALLAVARSRAVGVDLEYQRTDLDLVRMADRFFSPGEAARLRRLPGAERLAAFFRCWTCKEAYLKATGRGLSLPLDSFDVSLAPGKPAVLLRCDGDAARWTLCDLPAGPEYAAALAVDGPPFRLRRWQWRC